jgi:hypothetical protein
MISLSRILEQQGLEGQFYDLGKDFADFKRALDGNNEIIKQKYERSINSKLGGKRVRARASKGYKQFEKDYEFLVSRVTIDDYYDNFVIVAHDDSDPKKSKEYFIKPGFKIQVIGLAGNPTQTPDGMSRKTPKVLATPEQPPPPKSTVPVREEAKYHDIYSMEDIIDDIKPWVSQLVKDKHREPREFVKTLGGLKDFGDGRKVAMYDVKIPDGTLKVKLTDTGMQSILDKVSRPDKNTEIRYKLVKFDDDKEGYKMRIKKTMTKSPEEIPS